MRKLLVILSVLISGSLQAQSLNSEVIVTGGGEAKSLNVELDWTFGEVFSETLTGSGAILQQGYHNFYCGELAEVFTEIKNVQCFGAENGSLVIDVPSGKVLNFKIGPDGDVRTGSQLSFDTLAPGTYTLYAASTDSCSLTETEFVVEEPFDFSVEIDQGASEIKLLRGESVDLTAFGASTYNWSPATGLSDTTGFTVNASPTETTTYILTGYDIDGCSRSDTLLINVVGAEDVSAPVVFTPNGDGQNDTWIIPNIEKFSGSQIRIYNRWGQELISFTNYQNTWDGRINGTIIPSGTYYYVIEIPGGKSITGDINIVR